jgi:hypothetical protein
VALRWAGGRCKIVSHIFLEREGAVTNGILTQTVVAQYAKEFLFGLIANHAFKGLPVEPRELAERAYDLAVAHIAVGVARVEITVQEVANKD